MKSPVIKNSTVEVGIIEECGHLCPVRFIFENTIIEPMHNAPWKNEDIDASIPPSLKYLSGDFFCAPFGNSDLINGDLHAHGASANNKWNLLETTELSIKLQLSKKILGAELIKEISVNMGERVIYQKHIFIGGEGRIPVGHHAMLKIPDEAYISFSEFSYGGTPPDIVEPDPEMGRSILKYPQEFNSLSSVKFSDGSSANISRYPFANEHEDLYMIISDNNLQIAWSAVSCPANGWLWFSFKDQNILPCTVVWLSNGGRYYPPFSSRHKNVIGIEATASFFHLGHKASIEENFLTEKGIKTYIDLHKDRNLEIPYLFGVAQIPEDFGRVKSISEIIDGIEITGENEKKIKVKLNLNFIRNTK